MTIYDFNVQKTSGERVPLYQFEDKIVVIINTASKCKFTPQFDDLQKLYEQYHDQGVELLGFPCNQFAQQEPGSSEDAAAFCQINYGVKFPILAKVDVNGEDEHPLFYYLKKEAPFRGYDETDAASKLQKLVLSEHNPEWTIGNAIKWNFTKFLINKKGQVVQRYEPSDDIDALRRDIDLLLQE